MESWIAQSARQRETKGLTRNARMSMPDLVRTSGHRKWRTMDMTNWEQGSSSNKAVAQGTVQKRSESQIWAYDGGYSKIFVQQESTRDTKWFFPLFIYTLTSGNTFCCIKLMTFWRHDPFNSAPFSRIRCHRSHVYLYPARDVHWHMHTLIIRRLTSPCLFLFECTTHTELLFLFRTFFEVSTIISKKFLSSKGNLDIFCLDEILVSWRCHLSSLFFVWTVTSKLPSVLCRSVIFSIFVGRWLFNMYRSDSPELRIWNIVVYQIDIGRRVRHTS